MTDFDSWAILELFGHRRLAGRVSEQDLAGGRLLRIDIYGDGDHEADIVASQLYGHGAIFSLTPCDETVARQAARWCSRPLAELGIGLDDEGDDELEACDGCDSMVDPETLTDDEDNIRLCPECVQRNLDKEHDHATV